MEIWGMGAWVRGKHEEDTTRTSSHQACDMSVAGHFPIGNLLDCLVDGVEEGFRLFRARHCYSGDFELGICRNAFVLKFCEHENWR